MEIEYRKKQLRGLLGFLQEHETALIQAVRADVGKPIFEIHATELGMVRSEIHHALKHLAAWTRPKSVCTPLVHQAGTSWIQYEPLGKILIIAPWNYPIQLTLVPLVNALAAGNQTVLKPSELAPHCAKLFAQKLPNSVDTKVYEGGPEVTQKLLEQKWDHILFTGSTRIGKLVYEKAAQTLSPVTLELGGKCPVILDNTCQLKLSARRIAWGKLINAGQTCVAPDYLLAHQDIVDNLVLELRNSIQQFFGKNPENSPDYGRIVNQTHLKRLLALAPDAVHNVKTNYFAPTILQPISADHLAMQEEIFGPILPILSFQHLEEAIGFVNARPKPLALYCFSESKVAQKQILSNTHSGGLCINDTLSHLGIPALPFGGVGDSGFGAYHGRWGFERFSHAKSIYSRNTHLDLPVRYPPYTPTALKIANWFQR